MEWGELPIGRNWKTLESASLLKKGPAKEGKGGKVAMTVTVSPEPPPIAPLKFSAGPRIQNFLGCKITKCKDRKGAPHGKITKEIQKGGGNPKGKIPKDRMAKGKKESEGDAETGEAAGIHYT